MWDNAHPANGELREFIPQDRNAEKILMANCELLLQCPFFNDRMANMPVSSACIKEVYCRTDSSSCARYLVAHALGRERVPPDLFPSEMKRSKRIIARG